MRLTRTVLLALGLCLLLVPVASAGVFEDLYVDYAKDGKLNACAYPESLLKKIKSAIPKDIEQYAPDFPAELDAAIATRAQGKCKGGSQSKKTTVVVPPVTPPSSGGPTIKQQRKIRQTPGAQPAPATAPPAPAPQTQPAAPIATSTAAIPVAARDTGSGGGDLPAPVILLFALGLPLALVGGVLLGSRWWGWEPRWAEHLRHSVSEAGWRASSTWAEFTDFVRLGR